MFQTDSTTETFESRTDWYRVGLTLGALLLLYYLVPLASLLLSQSPGAVVERLGDGYVIAATRNSLVTATASTLLSATFGLPLAYWLARTNFGGKNAILTLVLLPLVFPPIVSGMLLLQVFGPAGLGGLLSVEVTRSLVGIVLAQTFVASPFFVVTAKAAFESVDRRLEYASRSLGKDGETTFRKVTLPLAKPGIVAGLTLTFARAMGEFGATLMLAYYPRTLPVQIWQSFLTDGLDAAFPVAVVLVGVAVVSLLVINALGRNPWRGESE
ncbi:ABC transporter permease subunit [Haloarculaceae archaeon H-GB2-1]|nr:ABC transporter permease subunit [Haloarculaceae archaeon H-GB1-1]MEA5386886.1 ABC transporter permease subunit [Haloarculaceae archaeon H-GB11]MEA5408365.1 ABC transporter permease subunit [Haloarculaceae archaeon H-GB2-1]